MTFEITEDEFGITQMRVGYNGTAVMFNSDLRIQFARVGKDNPDYRGLIINVENKEIGSGSSAVIWLHEDSLPEFFVQCLKALDEYNKETD